MFVSKVCIINVETINHIYTMYLSISKNKIFHDLWAGRTPPPSPPDLGPCYKIFYKPYNCIIKPTRLHKRVKLSPIATMRH